MNKSIKTIQAKEYLNINALQILLREHPVNLHKLCLQAGLSYSRIWRSLKTSRELRIDEGIKLKTAFEELKNMWAL